MFDNHCMKIVCHVVCFVNAVAALHIGLMAIGYNILFAGFLGQFARPIEYIFGISGLIGLVMFFMRIFFCGRCTSCNAE